jgi:hypothetical protein
MQMVITVLLMAESISGSPMAEVRFAPLAK